jgi:hypothetical protein
VAPVEEGAVGAPQIAQNVTAVLTPDLGVTPRNPAIRDENVALLGPPQPDLAKVRSRSFRLTP